MKLLILFLVLISPVFARLGENQDELVARLGQVKLESKHYITAQGQISPLGPALFFEKDQWNIQCDLIDGRCAKITYTKPGEWTPEQISTLLQNNAQGLPWREPSDSNKMIRKWTRSDGGTAKWQFTGSMELISKTYLAAKARREGELKSKARQQPDL